MRELMSFPQINVFRACVCRLLRTDRKKTLKLVHIHICVGDVNVGRYMKELAILRCEREWQPIISDCIEEIREELEKYGYFRSVSQPIGSFINTIEEEIDKYEKKKKKEAKTLGTIVVIRSQDVGDNRGNKKPRRWGQSW